MSERRGKLVALDEYRADAALRAKVPACFRAAFEAADGNWLGELAAMLGAELAFNTSPELLILTAQLLSASGAVGRGQR